jgi:hypothetical protein
MGTDDVMYEDAGDVELVAALAGLRHDDIEPPAGFAERLSEFVGRELRWRLPVRRLVNDRRAQYAAVSLGGALLGAAAIALLWKRDAKRQQALA